jgi:hypothetical protein
MTRMTRVHEDGDAVTVTVSCSSSDPKPIQREDVASLPNPNRGDDCDNGYYQCGDEPPRHAHVYVSFTAPFQ